MAFAMFASGRQLQVRRTPAGRKLKRASIGDLEMEVVTDPTAPKTALDTARNPASELGQWMAQELVGARAEMAVVAVAEDVINR